MTKYAQGRLDLHAGRSQVDFDWLAERLQEAGADAALCARARKANTAMEVLEAARAQNLDLAGVVAARALVTARDTLRGEDMKADIVIIDRQGEVIAHVE